MRCSSGLHYQKTKIMELQSYLEILDSNTSETLEILSCETGLPLHTSRDGSWNLLQVLEHLVLTDRYVYSLLRRPSWYFATVTELFGEHKLRKILVEKNELLKAPPALEPSPVPTPLENLITEFIRTRMFLKRDLQNGAIIIDRRYYINPFLGEMTVADWLWFIVIHTERHHLQLQKMYAELNRRAC